VFFVFTKLFCVFLRITAVAYSAYVPYHFYIKTSSKATAAILNVRCSLKRLLSTTAD
jgi:hypothetical protein